MKKIASILLLLAGTYSAMAADGKALTQVCAACHGADGNSPTAAFPSLAGQGQRYLVKQMQDIKSGDRAVPEMTGQLNNLTDKDFAAIAAFYSAEAIVVKQAATEDADVANYLDLGQQVYLSGNSEMGVTACAACHSPTGAGNSAAGWPALGGQHAGYIVKQLTAFRAAGRNDLVAANFKRVNDGDDGKPGMMQDVAKGLSDAEIKAVANYISGLH